MSAREAFVEELAAGGVQHSRAPELLARASRDFGGHAQGNTWLVAAPRSTAELRLLVGLARQHGVRLTARGSGGSQAGQSIPNDGVSVDFSGWSGVSAIAAEGSLDVDAGATFRSVVEACRGTGWLPPVMPLHLDLTVGGVLSAGGFGSTSHRNGLVASQVRSFEAVLGQGELVRAGPSERRDVFDAVLAGQGKAGLIATARLALEQVPPTLRTLTIVHDDFGGLLDELLAWSGLPEVLHQEAFCCSTFHGLTRQEGRRVPLTSWSYSAQLTTAADVTWQPETRGRVLGECIDDTYDFAGRYDLRFEAMRATGAWQAFHPWFEVLLPAATARELVPQAVRMLPPFFGDAHRILVFADTDRPSSFQFPSDGPVVGFAVLPLGIPGAYHPAALAVLERLDRLCREGGGMRYRSGHQFGERGGTTRSSPFDPDGIFSSSSSSR
ncbi:MAG TPA: FAD-binding oxidoreductase [Polyangiaceae bacterium]|nr:FAD-binding oxidoreductase [Polyangiaceae bacterium]